MVYRKTEIDPIMRGMPLKWRGYWCESEVCACLGCANRAGKLKSLGFSKTDWRIWCRDNPSDVELLVPLEDDNGVSED